MAKLQDNYNLKKYVFQSTLTISNTKSKSRIPYLFTMLYSNYIIIDDFSFISGNSN